MKRKSERRRAESRKKRCAAHNSSEAAPNSDIYIEITDQIWEREVRVSGNHELNWLRDRPSNRLGNLPGAYHVSYVENFKLGWVEQSLTDRTSVQSSTALHFSQPIAFPRNIVGEGSGGDHF
ncbi:hypothetical protein D9C73_012930 [Collichthys lucidus]|uniref:Uncharacterized protein n=1 Tax=Collichthys lucidus TaxID=240159 RepID=A0A4U5USW6_COLLU|nr:hypothetical protein D9C73_012930 [Collichthys lucidus]